LTPADLVAAGLVFDVDTFAVHDGPGIRMAVYFKGCPLRCQWCHSPESQGFDREVVFLRHRCTLCGACVAACPAGAQGLTDGERTFDRSACRVCGGCVERCPAGALAIKGETVSAGDIVARAVRMRSFFDHSGGGVTLTGGEVTAQPEFAAAILAGCRAEGIHAAVETAGPCTWESLQPLADLADLILYDLKLIDDALHRRYVGSSNERILDNARRLAGREVIVRVPLIPGVTDTDANLEAIFAFMRAAGLPCVELLPYNPSTPAKYEWTGRPFELTGDPQDQARLAAITDAARAAGLEVVGT
jgi:pyruvate formate lyase activating enzyme